MRGMDLASGGNARTLCSGRVARGERRARKDRGRRTRPGECVKGLREGGMYGRRDGASEGMCHRSFVVNVA